jgi:lysozyme family protein
MTLDAFVTGIFDREGRTYEEPPRIDQPTGPGGVTLPVLCAYRGRRCTVDDLRRLTVAEAGAILRWTIDLALTRWHFDRIAYEPLRLQLLDFAWNSGEGLAVRWLQRTVLLPEAAVDGVIGPQTLAALDALNPVLVHNALAAQRAHMVLTSRKIAKKFKGGVINRALGFVLPVGEAG